MRYILRRKKKRQKEVVEILKGKEKEKNFVLAECERKGIKPRDYA